MAGLLLYPPREAFIVCVCVLLLQDVQVYSYYRDLINFKHRGDPAMMLRCINPNEAKYLDAAAGIHIKFRLAGVISINFLLQFCDFNRSCQFM